MESLSWITSVDPIWSQRSLKVKAGVRARDVTGQRGWSERCYVSGFEDGGKGPWAKEWEGPLEAGKARKPSPPEPPEGGQFHLHLKPFLFHTGVQSINNVAIVSCQQQTDSAIHMHVSILPQTPFPSRLPHNIEESSPCYTVSPWLAILNIAMCTCPSQTP